MKKNILKITMLSGLMACLFSSNLSAQNVPSRFSIGAEAAFPTSDYGNQATAGFGGSLRYEIPLGAGPFALMATGGYLTFGAKTSDDGSVHYKYTNSAIPIQLGLKLYVGEQQKGLYIDAEGGVHLLSTGADVTYNGVTTSSSYNKTAISYAPGIGIAFANFDIGVKYQMFSRSVTVTNPFNNESTTTTSTESYVGVRLAFVF